jgi:hypothetical protein
VPELTNDDAVRAAVSPSHAELPGLAVEPRPLTALYKLRSSAVGHGLISAGLLFTLLAIIVVNLPTSQFKSDLARLTQPYVNAVGLGQDWSVFSSPRTTSAFVYARVDYADGSTSVVPFPAGRGVTAYADYRWRKYEERIRQDSSERLWAPYAEFVAKRARQGGRQPVHVSLVRRWADSNPPGPGTDRAPWLEYTFYSAAVGGTA